MPRDTGFRSLLTSLWLRLNTLAILALVFYEALFLASGRAQGMTFYLSAPEVAFEVAVRVLAVALAGVALGTICTALTAPFLWYFQSSRENLVELATTLAVIPVVILVGRFALQILIKWSHYWFGHHARFDAALVGAYYLAFAVALLIPRTRREVATSFDGFLSKKMTRRAAITTVVGAAAVVTTEFLLSKRLPTVKAALVPQRPKSNFLLITFDALDAEDMSLYGRGLPTTPNIDSFARKGTVFTNFYSGSTFTTPSVATIMTGLYPSESHVYHREAGQLSATNAEKSLPHLMHAAGYATGAFMSNPLAYFLAKSFGNAFDVLPEPVFQEGGLQLLWDATRPLHQDSGIGCRLDEYDDMQKAWNSLGWKPDRVYARVPVASFEQARRILAQLPDGFFLWVHVLPPHGPYLPGAGDRGRFLPAELRTSEEDFDERGRPLGNSLGLQSDSDYAPDQQSQVDERRLRYDEFIATADRAFGDFILELENRGTLRNTTVIVSADHGESFEGGVYQHESPYLTRPVIHVPLIIRTPGQQEGRKVAFTADQTALAPTILDLAGVPKPDSMRGPSLVGWLNRDGQGEGEGLAFTQYLERNSVFKPLRHGTVGVIDGHYEYVLDIDTQKGALRPLNEAQLRNVDRSAENPARAEALRAAIHARFPDLVQMPS